MAIEAAQECLRYKANYAGAYFEIGQAYEALGNKVKALESYKKCLNDRQWRPNAEHHIKIIEEG